MNKPQTEAEYLNQYRIHDYDIPLTTVDMAIFTVREGMLHVLLVKRAQFPSKGHWALPGGFVDIHHDNTIDDTARAKLAEKTGIDTPYLEQVQTVGSHNRDPRGWAITVVYFALIASEHMHINASEHSEEIRWMPLKALDDLNLAFDHSDILRLCLARLKDKVQYTSLPIHLLPDEFTLSELQYIFELLLDKPLEKKSFRRRILDAAIIEETGTMKPGSRRPAKLYRACDAQAIHRFNRNLEGVR